MIAPATSLKDRSINQMTPKTAEGYDLQPASWLANAEEFCATPIALARVPGPLIPWLTLEDSMTEAISRQFGQSPEVAVHYSGTDCLREWEIEGLAGNESERRGYARHISLNINARPVLLARSVTHRGNCIEPLLSQLQTTPLARLLFEDDQWQRSGTPLPLQMGSTLLGRACVWQDRRSGQRLMVEEFFNFEPTHPSTADRL